MPLGDFSDILEEIDQDRHLLAFSNLSGGVGTRTRIEHEGDLKSLYGYWYGYLDTWFPKTVFLPLLSTATTPTGISASKSDYASMVEAYVGGQWRVILAKGENVWQTTGASFGTPNSTATGAQGRQLLACYLDGQQGVVWFAGPNAPVRYTLDGINWHNLGRNAVNPYPSPTYAPLNAVCGWNQYCRGYIANVTAQGAVCPPYLVPATWRIYAIDATTRQTVFMYKFLEEALNYDCWNMNPTECATIPALSTTDVIPLGPIDDPSIVYLANGPQIWAVQVTASTVVARVTEIVSIQEAGLRDVTAGCRVEDRLALSDGTQRILLWHPSQPPIDVSLWGDDGVPDSIRGGVKTLQSLGPYLIAWWEMDNVAPVAASNRGKTMIYWSRPNLQGQTTWHPRSGVLAGGFPLSTGSPMVLAEKTVAGERRLWVCTADGSAGRAYYQDHPLAGYNPTADTAGIYSYEDGPKALYLPSMPLQLVGDEAGSMMDAEVIGNLSAAETVTLGYRANYEALGEEANNATWEMLPAFTDKPSRPKFNGDVGIQAQAVQAEIIMDRGGVTTKTPILRHVGITVNRARRKPSLDKV
jgi:hypothetical protein